MTDSCKTTMLAGVAGGYLLGRTKKAKVALSLAAFLAGSRLAPQDLLSKGVEKIAGTPQLAGLSDQVRDQMIEAARTAVGSVVDRRVESLTGSLRERTDRLGAPGEEPEEESEEEDAPDARDEEGEDRGRRSAASKRKKAPAREKAAGTAKSGSAGPRKKAASGGEGGSRRTVKSSGKSTDRKSGKKPARKAAEKSADRPRRR